MHLHTSNFCTSTPVLFGSAKHTPSPLGMGTESPTRPLWLSLSRCFGALHDPGM